MNVAEYWINQAIEVGKYKNEGQLAAKINISRGLMGNIKKGVTRMPPHACKVIAEITGEDQGIILLSIMADRAKDQEERAALFQVIQRANPQAYDSLAKASECILC